uniref:Serine protease 41 n=1 Tax=Prolemur simus TaxID=1328070 RepID=A0A8C8YCL7_PROSS
ADHVGGSSVTFLHRDTTPGRAGALGGRADSRGPPARAAGRGREGRAWPCGHRDIQALLVGGVQTVRGRWPWQALLRVQDGYFCGGSLLSRRWVLSAAHCFKMYRNASNWWVQLGELNLLPSFWNVRAYINRYRVKDIIVNPSYHGNSNSNDIALLRLATSVTYSKYIQPICVLSSTFMFLHRPDCWVTGWGSLRENETSVPAPYNLQEAQLTVFNNTRCNYLFQQPSGRSTVDDSMFCAGAENGSVDTCRGDSGGPLVCDKDGLWYLVGVVSWGIGCGWPNRPGVYANVSRHFTWIQKVMSCSTPRPDFSRLLLLLTLLWSSQLLQPVWVHQRL